MPRDLLADKKTLNEMPQLSREPASSPPPKDSSPTPLYSPTTFKEERFKKMGKIHPFAQLLNVEDLDDCDWLEHAAFDPIEAATREKLEYRLQTCGELCSGLFSSAYPTSPGPLGEIIKSRTFQSIDASDSDRKRILIGHIIATKSSSPLVTDASMDYPKDWQTNYQLTPSTGHNEDGQTVCLHSLCVHPNFSGKGFGQILLKSYVQRIRDAEVAKRIALICRDRLVRFYENAGFHKVGPSKCQYGGGNWVDMVIDFEDGMGDDDPDF
ncbi:acetyltransferase [Cucurbitaria berberidis CBS 394.84]|uniref:Acetyltransferase n=1 Tax=Cucurbitaria berberidis CBS 394.84 TaxID=1168544 RepID=A0A9P4L6M5_9PLEO|nr:acetyltransferase [Cucurbitaria berberidis CBS 394.84]KAF1843517.1 acetyltransferase [Cucurbitaria berberidis CBS 394.84]